MGSEAPSASQVLAQLDRLLASRQLAGSARLCRFLRFVVEKHLCGESGTVKEYVLALEVFDRKADYDPRQDSVVRVEARRLRAKIHSYYETDGAGDEVRIELRASGYQPEIRWLHEPVPPAPPAPPAARSVAVLPFLNLSPEPDQEYFCDGVTEEIINVLAQVDGLRVVARTSAFQFRGRALDVREAGRALQATHLVEGSLRKSGAHIRLTAQLIDAATGYHLWSQTYDRELADIFAVEDELARLIAEAVTERLLPEFRGRRRGEVEAYTLYLRGRHHWNKRNLPAFAAALAQFEECVETHPDYAPGWVGLADSLAMLVTYGERRPAETVERMKQACLRALERDPLLAEAHCSFGAIASFHDWDWAAGAAAFQRSLQLQPGYVTARHWYGMHLAAQSRLEEAEAQMRTALEYDPLSLDAHTSLALVLVYRRDYQQAAAQLASALELDPDAQDGLFILGTVWLQQGLYDEAIDAFQRARRHTSEAVVAAAIGGAHALAGRRDEARRALDEITDLAAAGWVSPFAPALLHTCLGEAELAVRALAECAEERITLLSWLRVDPRFDALRGRADFRAVLERIGV